MNEEIMRSCEESESRAEIMEAGRWRVKRKRGDGRVDGWGLGRVAAGLITGL